MPQDRTSGEPEWLKRARQEGRVKDGPLFQTQAITQDLPKIESIQSGLTDTFDLCKPSFAATPPTWVIPLVTVSEINARDWKKRSKRSNMAWKAVSKAFGPTLVHVAGIAAGFHTMGKTIHATFTRIGGRKLDRSNLPTSMKGVEDAVVFILGIDDGDERWQAKFAQRSGGSKHGVEVRLETK